MSHSHFVCGKSFSVQHCLSTPTGGFPAIRHNEVRDITAEKFIEVCPNVEEQLSGELFAFRMSISCDEERLDISANGVWGGNFEKAIFGVRVYNQPLVLCQVCTGSTK